MGDSATSSVEGKRRIFSRLGDFLTAPASRRSLDGRWIVLLVCLLYCGFVYFRADTHGWTEAWRTLRVPAASVSFLDGRAVLQAADRYRHGVPSSLIQEGGPAGDLRHLQVAYPSLWFYLLRPTGLGEKDTVVVAVSLGVLSFLFTLAFAGRLSLGEGCLYTLLLISPPVMMLVERGNVDLFLYILLVLACVLLARGGFSVVPAQGIIVFTGMLKIYPIAAVASGLKRRGGLLSAALAFLCFCAYGAVMRKDLEHIAGLVPRLFTLSFGARTFLERLDILPRETMLTIAYSAMFLVTAWAFWSARRGGIEFPIAPDLKGSLFFCGSLIFFSCFLIGNSYVYRMHFFLFLLPQLLAWARLGGRVERQSRLAIALLIVSAYLFSALFLNWIGDLFCWWVLWQLVYLSTAAMKPEIDKYLTTIGRRAVSAQ